MALILIGSGDVRWISGIEGRLQFRLDTATSGIWMLQRTRLNVQPLTL
ncbi:MAG: hypothetical protein OXC42_00185 [Gammaproteobacteria bacterium]|nr:hypothetical protein [Gammaproteobacteria bacterium]